VWWVLELPVFPVPLMLSAGTSRHCWSAPFRSLHCTTWEPSPVDWVFEIKQGDGETPA
jgi:hypothetical protein